MTFRCLPGMVSKATGSMSISTWAVTGGRRSMSRRKSRVMGRRGDIIRTVMATAETARR